MGAEQALVAVVQEACVHGVSMSQVSRLCQALDADVERFRTCTLEGPYPYLGLDSTLPKVRPDGCVVLMALMIAIGVNARGEREVLGLDAGPRGMRLSFEASRRCY